MMEAYKKVGRGGAGNFWSKKDIEESEGKGKGKDIEAQPTHNLTASLTSSQPPSEYLHTGRGGAGNWVQPTELLSQGLAQQAAPPNPTAEAVPSSPRPRPRMPPSASSTSSNSTPRYRGGRGGAGNYSIPEPPEERERKERLEREAVEEKIRLDVEAGLAKPPKAYGGFGGSWEMGPVGQGQGQGVGSSSRG